MRAKAVEAFPSTPRRATSPIAPPRNSEFQDFKLFLKFFKGGACVQAQDMVSFSKVKRCTRQFSRSGVTVGRKFFRCYSFLRCSIVAKNSNILRGWAEANSRLSLLGRPSNSPTHTVYLNASNRFCGWMRFSFIFSHARKGMSPSFFSV